LALGNPRRIFFRRRRRRWGRFGVIALAFAGALALGTSGGALPVPGSNPHPAATPQPK
jgi:drug/metabolite transporter (DMT)-like permease